MRTFSGIETYIHFDGTLSKKQTFIVQKTVRISFFYSFPFIGKCETLIIKNEKCHNVKYEMIIFFSTSKYLDQAKSNIVNFLVIFLLLFKVAVHSDVPDLSRIYNGIQTLSSFVQSTLQANKNGGNQIIESVMMLCLISFNRRIILSLQVSVWLVFHYYF